MKWWFLLFLRGIAVGGPFNTENECIDALKTEINRPIIDPGFDGASSNGLCFQARMPDK